MWQKSKIQNVTKPKKLKCDTIQKLNILQNSTTQIKQQEKKCGKTEEKKQFVTNPIRLNHKKTHKLQLCEKE